MKRSIGLVLLLVACSRQPAEQTGPAGTTAGIFSGQGRDRLCIANGAGVTQIGIVTYGEGDYNCTFKGKVGTQGGHEMLVEAIGDPACKLMIQSVGETLTVGVPNAKACEYYCGPTSTMADRSFKRDPSASSVVDLAGDPLC